MGYDMYWVQQPPEIEKRYAEAREVFAEAVRERDALPEEERGDWDALSPEDRRDLMELEGLDALPPDCSDRYRAAQKAVRDASDAIYRAEAYYFRLNIFGMPRFRKAMWELDMLYDSWEVEQSKVWPETTERIQEISDALLEYKENFTLGDTPASFENLCGVAEGQARWYEGSWPHGHYVAATPDEAAQAIEYLRAVDAALAAHPQVVDVNNPSVIPSHKLGSNDGWHVTPDEITAALRAYQSHTKEQVEGALVKAGVIESVTRADEPDPALENWDRWIDFLRGAARNGGFKVF